MRQKLIELLGDDVCKSDYCGDCEYKGNGDKCIVELKAFMADHLIANDVVPVVRCKYCKHYGCERTSHIGRTKQFCKLHKGLVVVNRDTFCAYGEREDND